MNHAYLQVFHVLFLSHREPTNVNVNVRPTPQQIIPRPTIKIIVAVYPHLPINAAQSTMA